MDAPAGWQKINDHELVVTVHNFLLKSAFPDEDFEAVPILAEGAFVILAVTLVEAEYFNGGLEQALGNPSGAMVPNAMRGYRILGLTAKADVLMRAIEFAGLDLFPSAHAPRDQAIKAVADAPEWDELNQAFEDEKDEEGPELETLQAQYIRAHPEEFFR